VNRGEVEAYDACAIRDPPRTKSCFRQTLRVQPVQIQGLSGSTQYLLQTESVSLERRMSTGR
jgi:hypothetical protein